jgi:outer membrane murein-binding lipoprotein Lpp
MPKLPTWAWWALGAAAVWWLFLRKPAGAALPSGAVTADQIADAVNELGARVDRLEGGRGGAGRAARATVEPEYREVRRSARPPPITVEEAMGGTDLAEDGAF